jgi:hypothetical protein
MAEPPKSTVQLYVSNLPAGTTNDRLKAAFTQFGAITDCFVPQRKRFGFVTFAEEADATKARTAMNDKPIDADAGDSAEEVISVVFANVKSAEKEEKKQQPAKKKQQPKKKEAKKPAEPKKPQGAPAEKKKRNRPKKAPAAKRSAPTFEDRLTSYDSDMGAKCLLLGYANWEAGQAEANYDKDEAGKVGSGFPGLEWLKQALTRRGLQNSLFKKEDTVTYDASAGGDSWEVKVQKMEGDNFILSCKGKEAPAEAGLVPAAAFLRTDLMNEAKFSISYDEEEVAINRAKLWLLERCQAGKAAAAAPAPAPAEAPAEQEEEGVRGSSTHVDLNNLKECSGDLSAEELAAMRAKTKKAAELAKDLTPEQQAEYGIKPGVAASAVREDSDDSDDEGADFQMGGEADGVMLGDY